MDPNLERALEVIGGMLLAIGLLFVIAIVWTEVVEILVANPSSFIRCGRKLQNLLRLPRWMRLFADSDPGMADDHVRFIGGAALPWGAMLITIVVWRVSLALNHEVPGKWFWYLVGVFVASLVCSWAVMLADQRRWARERMAAVLADRRRRDQLKLADGRGFWEIEEGGGEAEGVYGVAEGRTVKQM